MAPLLKGLAVVLKAHGAIENALDAVWRGLAAVLDGPGAIEKCLAAVLKGLAAVLHGLVQSGMVCLWFRKGLVLYGMVWLRSCRGWCNMQGAGCGLA